MLEGGNEVRKSAGNASNWRRFLLRCGMAVMQDGMMRRERPDVARQ